MHSCKGGGATSVETGDQDCAEQIHLPAGVELRPAVQWVRAVVFFAGAMACASMHRVTFSVLAIPIRSEFGLSLPQMGVLHSAVLAGYILGQVLRLSSCIPSGGIASGNS